MRRLSRWLLLLLVVPLVVPLVTSVGARAADAQFTTSDGVRLHVIEAGPAQSGAGGAPTLVFVPGWTMPAWIFKPQIDYFAQRYHVVALDPRGQGSSDIPTGGYDYQRRGRDIGDLIEALGGRPVVLVGWSLGVLDSLAYVAQAGDGRIAAMVLIDNSVGEDPPPVVSRPLPASRGPRLAREDQVRRFVAGMFRSSPGAAYLEALTEAALTTPPEAAAALSNYRVARTYWKEALLSVRRPVLYVVRPKFAAQAENLVLHAPLAETALFATAGHALFVDEPAQFNAVVESFLRRRVLR